MSTPKLLSIQVARAQSLLIEGKPILSAIENQRFRRGHGQTLGAGWRRANRFERAWEAIQVYAPSEHYPVLA